jgi:hypothetical protein
LDIFTQPHKVIHRISRFFPSFDVSADLLTHFNWQSIPVLFSFEKIGLVAAETLLVVSVIFRRDERSGNDQLDRRQATTKILVRETWWHTIISENDFTLSY